MSIRIPFKTIYRVIQLTESETVSSLTGIQQDMNPECAKLTVRESDMPRSSTKAIDGLAGSTLIQHLRSDD